MSNKINMRRNATTTKVIVCDRDECIGTRLTINNDPLECVKEFMYQGSKVTRDYYCN